jgi:hypothetical protein
VLAQPWLDDLPEALVVHVERAAQVGLRLAHVLGEHPLRRRRRDQLARRHEELHHLVDADDGRRRDRGSAEQKASAVHGVFTL